VFPPTPLEAPLSAALPFYFIYAEEKAGKNNFRNEKMCIINFFTEQFENIFYEPKGTEYVIKFINCLPKGFFKTGSGILNTLLKRLVLPW
jgi:hypothetical protein